MDTAEILVTAVDHPSVHRQFDRFVDELRMERRCAGRGPATSRTPTPEVIEHLVGDRRMRLGAMLGGRLVAVAAVDNDGAVAVAVAPEFRRRGIANELMRVVVERAAAIGYPPVHRLAAVHARLAG